jgi:hypothetical protein
MPENTMKSVNIRPGSLQSRVSAKPMVVGAITVIFIIGFSAGWSLKGITI